MTPDGPEMKILMLMEEDLHLVALWLAACELQTMTRRGLDVCSWRGICSQNGYLTQRVVKLRCRVMSDGVMSSFFGRNSQGFCSKREGLQTKGDFISVAVHVTDLARDWIIQSPLSVRSAEIPEFVLRHNVLKIASLQ
jgi:hypothetical protein